MSQLTMEKNREKYWSLWGRYNIETEKKILWDSFREFIDGTFGGIAVPLILADRQQAVSGVKKLQKDLKELGV